MNYVLIGAGGHAKAVCDAIAAAGDHVAVYADPRPASWLDVDHYENDVDAESLNPQTAVAIGIGGVTNQALATRLRILDRFLDTGRAAPPIIHEAAYVSPSAELGPGVIVLAGAVVQPAVRLDRGTIVNSRAVVEHDSAIGPGSHVAPGAIVLGSCKIGACAMIGAGAVVLPGSVMPDDALVPALRRYPQ